MKSFDNWKIPLSGIFIAVLMLVSAPSIAQFVTVGTPSGVNSSSTTYPSPYGNFYWGSRQQFLYPASELAAGGLAAGAITAIQFNVLDIDAAQPHENYQISIAQTATASLAGWESGLTSVYGPVTQAPTVGLNTFTFSSPFVWDGSSNIVIEICHSNTSFTDNCHVEWTVPLAYNGSYTYRADGSFLTDGGCSTTSNSCAITSVNCDRRPMTNFEGTLAACTPLNSLAESNVTATSADISFANISGDVYIEYGPAGFTPGTDENAGGGTITGPFTTSPQGISGLSGSTTYDVYVRQDCGSEWSANAFLSFTTTCSTYSTPYFESFESLGTTANATWPTTSCIESSPTETTASYRWNREDGQPTSGTGTGPNVPHDGGIYAYTESSSGVTGAIATLDLGPIDLSSLADPALSFFYHMHGATMGTLNVYASSDGVTWDPLTSFTGAQQGANTAPWLEQILSLSAYSGETISIRFEGVRGTSFTSDMAIDAISVEEAPTCFTPTDLTVDGFTATSADLSWSCTGCTGEFYVEYGAPGFTPGTGAVAGGGTVEGPIAGTSTTISPLVGDTDYQIYVRQDCGGGDGFSDNSTSASVFTGACADGGPSSTADSNLELVFLDGIGATQISQAGCPGIVGVVDYTAQSADVSEILSFDLQIDYGTCGGNFGGAGSIWVDWNENLTFEPGELIGSDAFTPPFSNTYSFTVPGGTALGPKKMRVIQQEGGALPLDPCGSFTWGSVWDFTLNVVAPPACTQPVADFNLLPDCGSSEFSIEVIVTDAGSSTGGLVDITNNGGEPALTGVAPGTYVIGPFTAGPNVNITVVNLDDPICNLVSPATGTDCTLCAAGPTSTADSNVELVEIDGFAGSGFSHVGCSPAVTGVEDLTALSVDIPNGFSYDVTVDLGTCGGNFAGAGTVWVDWNGDFNFSAAEVVGTSTVNPSSNIFTLSPPPGTPVGPKIMRVMQEEGGSLPLDPCGTFTWGSVMDFTVNVIADPGCLPPDADLAVDVSSCVGGSFEYFIEVTVNSVGDSPGGEVTISNSFDGNTIPNATVAGSPYVYGPFPSGTVLDVNLEHLGNALCTYSSGFTYNCPPPNDDCVNATVLTVNPIDACMGAAVSATTAAASTDGPDPGTCVISGLTDVWFEFTTGSSPYINWEITLGTMEAYAVEIYDGCAGTSLYCLADETSDPNTYVELEANTTYLFRMMTLPAFAGTFDICIEEGPDSPSAACLPEYSSTTPTLDVLGPIAGGDIVSDLDLTIDLDNPNVGDLLIELISPCGTSVVLQDQACDGLTYMDVKYNDVSANTFTEFCPIGIGEVQPVEALSGFNNQPIVGTWTLSVTNATTGTAQAVNSWCLVPTLYDGCPPPQIVVTDFTDNTITVNSDPNSCYDPINFVSYDLQWTGGGSATGVTFPYQITGLTPGTLYIVDAFSNCSVGGSAPASGGAAQTTLNCAPEDLCTYELTLTNTDATGWDGAFATVDNGWTVTDYFMDSEVSTQTWTILACPGNPITLSVNNGGNGALSSNQTISFVNSENVEVYSEAGPPESTLYSQADGCPDCAAAVNIEFTRLAADLVELNWDNIALPGNVDNVQVIVLIEDFFGSTEVANETFPAGTSSASVVLDGSYPFTDVTVQVITNCTNEGAGLAQTLTTLPGCDAASQCEYQFDMTSTDDGWVNTGLTALIDGLTSIDVALESGTSGTQSIFTCPNGTIDVTANVEEGGGIPDDTCINTAQFPGATQTISGTGTVTTITTCNFGGEFSSLNIGTPGTYLFTSSVGTDYFTLTDGSNNVIAAGPAPLEASVPTSGTYRLHINTNASCGSDTSCRTTTAQFTGPGTAGCDSYSFSLVLNPATDNVTLVSGTDFCDYENGDLVYSATTCPSCFTPINATVNSTTSSSVDISWTSNNVAGVDYTIYVGLPGFTPGVDEVSSVSGVTIATGAQGPETVGGLSAFTTYEAVVIEDCDSGNDPSDPSNTVPFTTKIDNDDCADVTPVSYTSPNVLVFNGSSVGANDNSVNESYGAGQAWEAFTLTNCAQNLQIEYCGSVPVFGTAFTGISTGCPAEFPTNYLVADESSFPTNPNLANCPDGNPILLFNQLSAGTYYIPVFEGVGAYQITITSDQCEGCTDPLAINFDPEAEVDDGSCIIPLCDFPTLTTTIVDDCVDGTFTVLLDIGNDGDAADYDVVLGSDAGSPCFSTTAFGTINVSDNGVPVSTGGVWGGERPTVNVTGDGTYEISSSIATDYLTLTDAANNVIAAGVQPISGILPTGTGYRVHVFTNASCGTANVGRTITAQYVGPAVPPLVGTFPGGTTGITVGPFAIGSDATITVEHNDDATCDQTLTVTSNTICGCTDPLAINFSPLADEDDGSCIVPDCVDPPTEVSYCYINNENTSFEFTPTTPGENIILDFTQGSVESNTFDDFIVYDGSDASAPVLYSNPAATTSLVGLVIQSTLGNGLFITITSDISVSCSSGSFQPIVFDMYCGFVAVEGCTDINAVNYDPEANVPDGSCVYAPANDDCTNAQTLTPAQYPSTQNVLGTLTGASEDGSTACVGTNGPDVFYTFNVPLENHYWVNLNPFGGFSGVVEVLDACDGTVVACENAPPSAPFCDLAQSGAGFPSDPACEAAVCGADAFCCNNSWDGICAGDAATQPACTNCLSTAPAGSGPISVFIQNLPAGDYIVRVRDYFGASYLTNTGQFLVNVQYFPFAGVQDNPNSFLYACNQGGFQLEDFVGATPQSGQGALDYQWYVYEEGGTFSNEWLRGEPNYVSRIFWLEMDYGNTYNVFVRILLDVPGVGPVWGVYPYLDTDPHAVGASACTISTSPNVTPTELRPNYTPTNANGDLYAMCDFAIAYNVAESENFRWRFDPDTDPNNGNEIFYTRGVGNPSVRLSWVNGLLPGGIYNVAVEVMVDGNWSGFSTVLPIELALPPNNVVIRSQFCNGTYSPNDYILSESVCEADLYQFRFTPVGGGTPSLRNSGNYVCFMSAANPPLTPGDYDVQVKVTQNGVPGDWGPACTITIAGPQGQGGVETPTLRDIESTSTATLFPNPNAGNEVRVELSGLGDGNHEVNVNIYDVYGKLISTDGFGHEGSEMSRLIRFDENLATGMYMVHVFVDGEQFTVERLVVK